MQLFSPRESKLASEKKVQSDVSQIAYLTESIEALQKRINKENDSWEKSRKLQRDVYSSEKAELQAEIFSLEEDVSRLKAERAILLKPIDEIRERAEKLSSEVAKRERAADEKEKENEETAQLLSQRLDELSERETTLRDGEKSLIHRRNGVETEAKMVSDGHIALNKETLDFHDASTKRRREIDKYEARVRAEIQAKNTILDEREKDIVSRETDIKEAQSRLADERGTLDRAWEELRKKQL